MKSIVVEVSENIFITIIIFFILNGGQEYVQNQFRIDSEFIQSGSNLEYKPGLSRINSELCITIHSKLIPELILKLFWNQLLIEQSHNVKNSHFTVLVVMFSKLIMK